MPEGQLSTNENNELIRRILERSPTATSVLSTGIPAPRKRGASCRWSRGHFRTSRGLSSGRWPKVNPGSSVAVPPTRRTVRVQNVPIDRVVDGVVVEHNAATDWFRPHLTWECCR